MIGHGRIGQGARLLMAAGLMLAVPLVTDTKSDPPPPVPARDAAEPPAGASSRSLQPRTKPFLSTYRLPDNLTFAGAPVPLQIWQVRERIEFEFYRFLEDEGDSIILA